LINTFQKLIAILLILATGYLYANTANGQQTFRTDITALSTEMNRLITFSINGTELIDHKGLTIGKCTPSNAQPAQTLSHQNVFQCTQNRVSRANKGLIKNVPGELRLYELLAEQNDTQTPVVVAPLCEETTYINDYCRNPPDKILSNVQIGQNASINGGQFQGHITNQGWISNVTLLPDATLTGGILTGYIINQGTIADSDFRGASLTGGTLAGLILNKSQIGGQFIDVNLAPNTLIRGGILKGEIKGDCNAPARLENLTVTAHSKLICVTITDDVILETGITIEKIQNDKPLTIRLDQFSPSVTNRGNPTVFTITGDNLPEGMGFTVDNCLPSNHELPGGTQTQRQFQCTFSGEAALKKGKLTLPKTTEILYPFQVQVNAPHPVSRQVTLDHQFNMQIPSLIYKKATGDRYLWTHLKLTPTEPNSPLRFEVLEYGAYTDTIKPTEESVILTDDLHLTIPRVTVLDAAGQPTDYWGELQLKANDEGKLFFEVQASGGFITMTGTVHDPLTGATVELYDNNGNLLKKQAHTTNTAGQFTLSLPDKKTTNYIKVYGGTLNGEPFQGELIGPCPSTGATTLSCHISPFSSLLMRLSALYPKNGVQQAQQHLTEVLGLTADPFLSPETTQVNLPLWREQIAQGAGLAFQLDHISSDIVDGYLDDEQAQQFLIGAKKRPVITETVAIDQTHLEQQLVENPIIVKGTLKVMSFSDANDLRGTENEVKHEDYLSGYAAVVERTTQETENPVSTEIVYNAFNVGRWEGQLNAETTTLYQIFMTEPDLLFLPRSEQKRIAEKLAAQDEFAQAAQLYEAELQFSESAAPDTRAFLIADLAESGISLLSESQTSGARRLLQTRVVTAKNTLQRRAKRSSKSPILSLPLDGQEMFTIFEGMRVVPRVTTGNVLNLEFYSNMSLWYALFDEKAFYNNETSWLSHILDAPLITPKAGWLDYETVVDALHTSYDLNAKRTRMPVANIVAGELGNKNEEANWKIYRNNPHVWFDAPQFMNIVSAADVVLRTANGVNVLEPIHKGIKKLSGIGRSIKILDKTIEKASAFKPVFEAAWQLAKLLCESQENNKDSIFAGLGVTGCNQRFGNLETFKVALELWPEPLPTAGISFDTDDRESEKFAAIKSAIVPANWKSLKELGNFITFSSKEAALIFLVDYTIVKPIILAAFRKNPNLKNGKLYYYDGDEISSREIAKTILRQAKILPPADTSYTLDKDDFILRNVRTSTAFLSSPVVYLKDFELFMKASEKFLKFTHNIRNLKESIIAPSDTTVLLLSEILRAIKETVNELSVELLQDIILSFTPAKMLAFISGVNQGSAMTWDWITAPSIISLQAIRQEKGGHVACPSKTDSTSKDCIKFSTLPKLEAVRYLSVTTSKDRDQLLLGRYALASHSSPSEGTGLSRNLLYSTQADKNANHFLVRSGFVASVENHAIFAPKDKQNLRNLMNQNLVTADWHVYRFKQLPDTEEPPINRNASNAFRKNYYTCETHPNFCVKDTTTYKKGGHKRLLNDFMDSKPEFVTKGGRFFADSIEYLDFTQVYGEGLLTHQTPGVYSDTTRFYVGGKGGDVYANTFNVYVLPNYFTPIKNVSDSSSIGKLINLNSSLKGQSRLDGHLLKLQLNINSCVASNTYWGDEEMKKSDGTKCTALPENPKTGKPYPGIKESPFYVMIRSIINGNIHWSGPKEIRLGDGKYTVISIPRAFPIDNSTKIYVYDAILEAWRKKTGRSIKQLFSRFPKKVAQKETQPFMSFTLDELETEKISDIAIKLYDNNGRRIEGAKVCILPGKDQIDFTAPGSCHGETEADGSITLYEITDGDYTLYIEKTGYDVFLQNITIDDQTSKLMVLSLKQEDQRSISAGYNHTCLLRKDGSVDCWGINFDGESTPPSGSFIQISAGSSHNCGIRTDGSVACWGRNNFYGQSTPPSGSFTQLSVGSLHSCGIHTNGTVECWGYNKYGASTPPSDHFTQISASASGHYTCGIRIDGTVACWGDDKYGQSSPPSGRFSQVSAGKYDHTCGIRTDGSVDCWGNDKDGQSSPLSGHFTQISLGWHYTCGIRTDGRVACWGEYHDTVPSGHFTKISTQDDKTCGLRLDGSLACWGWYNNLTPVSGSFAHISVGNGHICGLRKDGSVACWGNNLRNNFGQSTPPSVRFTDLSTSSHICAIRKEGSVACWGDNYVGQATPPSDDQFTQITTGSRHTCGIRKDNTVKCWGYNKDERTSPPSSHFSQVSAGFRHTCGIRKDENLDDNVECWGYNESSYYNWNEKAISPSGRFTQISAGFRHTCGILENESVKCWGGYKYNEYGKATPLPGRFTEISVGGSHTCGIRKNGKLACWGSDKDGQASPPSGYFTQVSASGNYTCAIRTDGSVACWGNNDKGQATPPSGNFSKVSAAAWGNHRYTCALRKDGIMVCWGSIARNISQDDFPTE
jgi:alpha-tubulin suppressor-like RCC1 family protein